MVMCNVENAEFAFSLSKGFSLTSVKCCSRTTPSRSCFFLTVWHLVSTKLHFKLHV